jgi:hypothetical protein
MKKYYTLLIFFVSICILCSCVEGRMAVFKDNNKIADSLIVQLIESINKSDKDALRGMFSIQASYEADDFDENIDALLQYIQGSVESWERPISSSGPYSQRAGEVKQELSARYLFTTSVQEYNVAIYATIIDTANPNNVGVYSFCIVNAKEYADSEFSAFSYWGSGDAGINIDYPQKMIRE